MGSSGTVWIVPPPGLSTGRADHVSRVGSKVVLLVKNGMLARRTSLFSPFFAKLGAFLRLHVWGSVAAIIHWD